MARLATKTARPCKACGEPITRAAPLSPRTCMNCYVAARKAPARPPRTVPPYHMCRVATTTPKPPAKATPKAGRHRNRSLLDLAHLVHTCTNCERYIEDGCEPAHANGAAFGKGMSLKADDAMHAALCHRCHTWLDQPGAFGSDPTGRYNTMREDRLAMWTAAYFKTMALYWRNGWIKVSA